MTPSIKRLKANELARQYKADEELLGISDEELYTYLEWLEYRWSETDQEWRE
jgi:hypothetical protein